MEKPCVFPCLLGDCLEKGNDIMFRHAFDSSNTVGINGDFFPYPLSNPLGNLSALLHSLTDG